MNDPGAELRRGESADLGLLVALAETDGRDPTVMRRAFETDIGGSDRLLLVAMAGRTRKVWPAGRASYFRPGPDAPLDVAPERYYLGGVW